MFDQGGDQGPGVTRPDAPVEVGDDVARRL